MPDDLRKHGQRPIVRVQALLVQLCKETVGHLLIGGLEVHKALFKPNQRHSERNHQGDPDGPHMH